MHPESKTTALSSKTADELFNHFAKTDPQTLINGILTSVSMHYETPEEAGNAIRPTVELLKKSKQFSDMIDKLTEIFRHDYRYHGRSLEDIIAAALFGGFVGGAQFALDGCKADPPKNPDAPISPPTQHLVN